MNHNDLCTTIDIDFRHEKITIHNYTEQILLRAFGVIENPDWKDFEYFLEDRCFPRTRDHAKEILREMNLPFYADCRENTGAYGRRSPVDYDSEKGGMK